MLGGRALEERVEAGLTLRDEPRLEGLPTADVQDLHRVLPLSVIDVGTGEVVEITDAPTAAYFWSPDGGRLLYLDPDPDEEQF